MASDAEIIEAFEKIDYETVLPNEEPFITLYEHFDDTSKPYFLSEGDRYGLFYFDEEITVDILINEKTFLNIINEEQRTILHLLYRGENDSFDIYFPFLHKNEQQMSFLSALKNRKTFRVHYLMSLYGGIFKAATKEYTLSDTLAAMLPQQ
ncbi:MAG TPA: hypothetical protein PK544_14285 [Spirochaetota bacterium]|nr:hypothetical protein [Spirochaetota bacterium]HPJ38225.1 hypothetical protein [Spirochaetota bacterium]HPQ54346.1 hypothetical protein [Spirochaetota bacterium]